MTDKDQLFDMTPRGTFRVMPPDHHDGLPVLGYRDQPGAAVDLVNRNKAAEERVLRILDELAALDAIDKRWLAIGRTQIEQGFMAVNRAVFKPERIVLPEGEA